MENSTRGPDWTDVATFLSALDALHGGTTGLVISSGKEGHSGILQVGLITEFPVLGAPGNLEYVETKSQWPCKDCTSLAQHIYGGLYKHDYAISQVYKQKTLIGPEDFSPTA